MGSSREEMWDLSGEIREHEFDQLAVYLVRDQHVDEASTDNRAEASLPRNLVVKASQDLGGNVSTVELFCNDLVI
ncbi:hypothetical protein JTE90_014610 [Oedothorax gibbosus]|uniref:Uncharacterized protein n=1 Tax=Oedothorax gibbosus TaxID=931172 RepID=A0AAV6VA63_9ARAC|nr:hypothetical protein JTE90_014610 [Oedothorax gibbosus]